MRNCAIIHPLHLDLETADLFLPPSTIGVLYQGERVIPRPLLVVTILAP